MKSVSTLQNGICSSDQDKQKTLGQEDSETENVYNTQKYIDTYPAKYTEGNTVTNAFIIFQGLWGVFEVLHKEYKKRFLILYLLFTLVGVGSWMFHMTLLYKYQLLDELPMFLHTSVYCYCLVEVSNIYSENFFSNKPLLISYFGFFGIFTLIYLFWPQPLLFDYVFAALIIWSLYLQLRIVYWKNCKTCKRLLIITFSVFVVAFTLWNIDSLFCTTLEEIRLSSSPALGAFTQLHGWWHAMAGYSANLQILFAIHTWYDFHKKEEEKRKLVVAGPGLSLQWE